MAIDDLYIVAASDRARGFEPPTIASVDPAVAAQSIPLAVHVGGRVAVVPLPPPAPRGAHGYRHQWPAIYWEGEFVGDQLLLGFDDDKNEYRLSVDGGVPVALPQPGRTMLEITGLGPGKHSVRLDKVTESATLVRSFDGFFVPRGGKVLPAPPPRARQIEFIGNSGMTGYGIRSATRTCSAEEVRLRTTAARLGLCWSPMRWMPIMRSMRCPVGNSCATDDGVEPERTMAVLYQRTLPDEKSLWQDPAWKPQVVVVMLFADFLIDLKPGEAWPDQAALVTAYTGAYRELVASLHERAPEAALVLPWIDFDKYPDETARLLSTDVKTAIRDAAAGAGVRRVDFPVLPDFPAENSACDYHWSHADHRQMANWMTEWLLARPELWRGR